MDYKAKSAALPSNNIPRMKEDPECILEIKNVLDKMFKISLDYKQDYGLKWLKGLQRYTLDKEGRLSSNVHLDRGHIVEVEFFGHFNAELTFPHPAVVLYDSKSNWLLVAPISTSAHGNADPLCIDIGVADGLRHDCGVRVNAIRVIDKNRVLYQHKHQDGSNCKIRSSKLDEIDVAILENYLPVTYAKHEKLKADLVAEKAKRETMEQELQAEKDNHIATLKKLELLQAKMAETEVAATISVEK
jgi:mRNA-degrading endonuclease toxin of MazEF toxin-antitoxin module